MNEMNKVCAWCKEPANEHVKGRKTTHGICAECKAKLIAPKQIQEINQAIDERAPHPVVRR